MTDSEYMQRALNLAVRGRGTVSPNPMVGAVLVKDGRIIGEGFHERYGGLHAERNAIADCISRGECAAGATIYVTLEPCCHYGKTPPCTEAIIENKIARVVIGSPDPNPKVGGKGVKILREHGIEVVENVLRSKCDAVNAVFLHYITTGMPYVVMKYAMTLDGKIAAYTGKSQWISTESSREDAHRLRNELSAVMVGTGTVLADDPMLNCRIPNGRNPVRIVCDTHLKAPLDSKLIRTAHEIRTIIITSETGGHEPYTQSGCEIVCVPKNGAHLDLSAAMRRLGELQIDSILLEGGGTLNWSALSCGLVNRVRAYIAPKLFGGTAAKSPIGGIGVPDPNGAYKIISPKIEKIGGDIIIDGEVKACSQE